MWDFSWIADPSAWAGLGTLIVLEVVLGIDNLVFISILTSRLHTQEQRRRAFLTGLGLALVMRLVLLSAIAWIVSLTEPLVTIFGKAFSWRDFILMGGGIFLLLKGTMELHERLEGGMAEYSSAPTRSGFWQVIIQILVLDAVFSLDSIITSVGMVDHIPVMMLAVVVAMLVMVMAAAPLTSFVERHPTVIILCLGFLMMIGLSLLMDGLGYHIPKGYLYAAICFSVLVEICNQVALRNRRKRISMRDMRESMAMAVLGLLGGGRPGEEEARRDAAALASESDAQPLFEPEERDMVARVIRLSGRTARFIMTPRHRVRWLDSEADYATACRFASESLSPWLPVLDPDRDEVLGVIHTGDLAAVTPQGPVTGTERPGTAAPQDDGSGRVWSVRPLLRPAPTIFEHASLTEMLETFREEPTPLAFVRDEYGSVVGCITPTDLVSVLAGQMGDMPAGPEACRQPDGSWLMPGRLTVDAVTSWLGIHLPPRSSSATPPSGTLAVPAGRRLPPVPGRACRTARVSRAAAGRRGWEYPRRDSRIDRKQGIRFSSFPLFLAAGAAAVGGCRIQGTGAVDPVPYLSPAGGQVMEGHPPLRVAFCVMPQGRPRPHLVRGRCRPASGAA